MGELACAPASAHRRPLKQGETCLLIIVDIIMYVHRQHHDACRASFRRVAPPEPKKVGANRGVPPEPKKVCTPQEIS